MKKVIVAGIVLLALGLVLGGVSFARMGFRFDGLRTESFETRTLELQEDFRSIRILGDTEHIVIQHTMYPTLEKTPRLEYRENEKQRHDIAIEDGTLMIRSVDERKWYERVSVLGEPRVLTLYLPEDDFGDLTIETSTGSIRITGFRFEHIRIECSTGDVKCQASAETISVTTSTGDITLSNLTAEEIAAEVSTGRVQLSGVNCGSLETTGSTGKVFLINVTAESSIAVRRSTGDVRLENCDAPDIRIQTDTGDVTGTLRSGKTFKTKTDTGRVQVPDNAPGGACEVTTDTGDIKLEIQG